MTTWSRSWYVFNKPIALLTVSVLLIALCVYRTRRNRRRTPKLAGPPCKSFLFGATQEIFTVPDLGALYADWENNYGPVYEIPFSLGSKVLVLGDPKGIAHLCANDTATYQQFRFGKAFSRRFFGDNLLSQEGETHKRQRRALSSGFSVSAIRNLVPVFLDCAAKLASEWNSLLESQSREKMTTDVQEWMNYISLDSIGKGGFSHDFQSLAGNRSTVMEAFDNFGCLRPTLWELIVALIGPIFPRLTAILPTERGKVAKALSDGMREIAVKLLAKGARDKPTVIDKSILGALIRSETASSAVKMSVEEIHAQMQLIIIAGYDTTSVTLTWALIELARNPEVQNTLRAELEDHIPDGEEVTYEKLMVSLPYLDAFLSEILRLHPAAQEIMREVEQDDIIPLSQPIVTVSGSVIDSLPVERGLSIRIPIIGVNRSEALWGPDAARFDPTRWLEERAVDFNNQRKQEIQGYRHLLTFNHGPRICLGRMFVIVEIKAVLSVIVRKFAFEFPCGPETKLSSHQSITPRPKVMGEDGPKVPLIIRKLF